MILTEIPRAIARHLASKPFFQAPVQIPVRAFCERDIVSWCASHMESLGLSVVVMATGGKSSGQAKPDCQRLDPINLTVRVFEMIEQNRSANGSGVSAESCAEAIAGYLSAYHPLDAAGAQLASVGPLSIDEVRASESPEGLWVWDVAVKSSGIIKTAAITQFTEREPESEFATPTV
jgi:hypothetical protein